MTDSIPTPAPESDTPLPFQPETPKGPGGGCSRAGLIGCGLLLLLLGVAAIVFLLKAGDLFAWAMTKFEEQVIEVLPEDFSSEEKQRLELAFRAATEAVRKGEADPLALQRLQERLRQAVLAEDGRMTREDALELIRVLEEVAGSEGQAVPAPSAAAAAR